MRGGSKTGLVWTVVLGMSAGALLVGAEGGGCGAVSTSPAPDFTGTWDVTYADNYDVTINLGGAIYTEEIGLAGGVITIDHEGQPLMFDLDCSLEAIVCPSEVLPASVEMAHDNEDFPHQVYMTIPGTRCMTEPVDADPMECGEGTANPECAPICEGEVVVEDVRVFGVIDEPGEQLEALLGAGATSNGVNCALLSLSTLTADITSTGTAEGEDWTATAVDGQITTAYAGGCVWVAETVDMELEGIAVGATIEITTDFSAAHAP